jgi:hypothetical protein
MSKKNNLRSISPMIAQSIPLVYPNGAENVQLLSTGSVFELDVYLTCASLFLKFGKIHSMPILAPSARLHVCLGPFADGQPCIAVEGYGDCAVGVMRGSAVRLVQNCRFAQSETARAHKGIGILRAKTTRLACVVVHRDHSLPLRKNVGGARRIGCATRTRLLRRADFR